MLGGSPMRLTCPRPCREGAWVSVELEGIAKPQPRYEHAAALLGPANDKMIIVGGHYSTC